MSAELVTATSNKIKQSREPKVLSRKQSMMSQSSAGPLKQGRWTKEEHFRFLAALKLYGKEWRKV